MRELVFNTGGRKLFIDDLQHLQDLIKSFESLYAGSDPFVISGVSITLVSGSTYDISSGYVWLGGRVRQFSGATGVNLSTAKFINVKDENESREYVDTIQKVAVTNYTTIFSNTTLGGTNSLRINAGGSVRRYVSDVLGSQLLLLSPSSTQQTVSGNLILSGNVTVGGALSVSGSFSAASVTTPSFIANTNFRLKTTLITDIQKSGALNNSAGELATNSVVKSYIDAKETSLNTAINTKADNSDGNKIGFAQMFVGNSSGKFDSTGLGIGEYSKWAICNGNNGTEDLRNLFIVGAGDSYASGATGGSATITLGLSNLPAHRHGYLDQYSSHLQVNSSAGANGAEENSGSIGMTINNSSQGRQTDYEGNFNPTPFDNRPPYYALYYIQKIT